jgi:hypothetical protein
METKPTNPKDSFGSSKVGISRVPATVLSEVGLAMDEGGAKYRGYNYRPAGVRASIYIDAVWRHLFLQFWDMGEDIDKESGLSHVTKAIASLVVLRDSMIKGNWTDDRPPSHDNEIMNELNQKKRDLLSRYPEPKENFTQKELNDLR